ncbi:MAG: hypothetical protein ACRDSP_12045 [Pseudonocardiaceae bacterium]
MTAERLRELCQAVRGSRTRVDNTLVADIESDVTEYRAVRDHKPTRLPPDDLTTLLRLMGWLIYETSWAVVQRVSPEFELLGDEERAGNEADVALIVRLANATRRLPWPQFAPRALGAIRAQALASSKRDTQHGYDDAWVFHEEGRVRYLSYKESLIGADPPYLLELDETLVQLALAETGTACRTAERVISRWPEGIGQDVPAPQDEMRWIQRMFRELYDGAAGGEEALNLVARIEDDNGLMHEVSEQRLAMVTAYRNPGIMTARALLLLVPMCTEMEILRRRPPGNYDSWEGARGDFIARFERAYQTIEKPVVDAKGDPEPLKTDHSRALVHLRLNLALLAPGRSLPSHLTFDPCLKMELLDNRAVESLSNWLAEPVNGKRRGSGIVIGSATMPSYIRGIEACRADAGVDDGYRQWRSRWFRLDRYFAETGRRDRVEQVLGLPMESTED